MRRTLGVAILSAGLGSSAVADGRDPAFGRWLVEDGKAVIEVGPCGNEACGSIVWLKNPFGADGRPKRDVQNADRAKRSRPLCGLTLIRGLEHESPGVWSGGRIYSSRDGKTYGVKLEAAGPDRLTVRGYLGLSLLGRSQTWTRDSGARGSCTMLARPGSER